MEERASKSVRCSACGFGNSPGTRLCVQCGAALPTLCPTCGAAVREQSRFCNRCGAPISEAVRPSGLPAGTLPEPPMPAGPAAGLALEEMIEIVEDEPVAEMPLEEMIEIVEEEAQQVEGLLSGLPGEQGSKQPAGDGPVEQRLAFLTCRVCNYGNPLSATYCEVCGAVVAPVGVPCPECGFVNAPGALFCDRCVHRLGLTNV